MVFKDLLPGDTLLWHKFQSELFATELVIKVLKSSGACNFTFFCYNSSVNEFSIEEDEYNREDMDTRITGCTVLRGDTVIEQ